MKAPHLCEATVCLTLEGQVERQKRVTTQLRSIGIEEFEFFSGVTPDDQAVIEAFSTGRVKQYPPCFRCGQEACDNPGCNNILLPVQVAVSIAFRRLLQHCVDRGLNTVAICEDDVVFAAYSRKLFATRSYREVLECSGLFSSSPTLIRLGGPRCPQGFFEAESFKGVVSASTQAHVSNYLFLCNRAFAELAIHRLEYLDHTADVLIHMQLEEQANCITLAPQVACDTSWALRTTRSLIHPKPEYLQYLAETVGTDSDEYEQEASRLRHHKKVARLFEHGFAGPVFCDFQRLLDACAGLGLEIGVNAPGRDGLVSWQVELASTSVQLSDWAVDVPYYVYTRRRYWLVPDPASSLRRLARGMARGDLSVGELLQSIEKVVAIPGDSDLTSMRTAVSLFIFWYRLARANKPGVRIYEQNLEESLANALAGRETPGPILSRELLTETVGDISPELFGELQVELSSLGFRLEA